MRKYSKSDLAALAADLSSPLPAPKKRSQEESIMQRALIRWWAGNCRHFNVPEQLLMSIPNGGGRAGARAGSFLKMEGLRKGAPDLLLALPGTTGIPGLGNDIQVPCAALFLELKRRDGVLSPEQEKFHELLRGQGYKVCVCWSLQECIDEITTYLT